VYLPSDDDFIGDDSFIGTDDSLFEDYDGGCDTDSRRIMMQDDSEYETEYLFVAVETTVGNFNNDGGFVCLSQSDDTNGVIASLLKYGDTRGTALPHCNQGAIYEDVNCDIKNTPGTGYSFQRIGKGGDPTDFTWTVAPETRGTVNTDQKLSNKFTSSVGNQAAASCTGTPPGTTPK
jgi:hypothetical protein